MTATTTKCGFSSLHSSQHQDKYYMTLNATGFLSKTWTFKKKINLVKHHYMTELLTNPPESNFDDLRI